MKNSTANLFILASALCFLALAGSANGDAFTVEGKVYCDTCRVQFITRLTSFMKDAAVKLECKDREGGSVTFSETALTDKHGVYHIPVTGDHEDEICELRLLKSSMSDCSEIPKQDHPNDESARISITRHNGMTTGVRNANPLGFMVSKPKAECAEVLKELGITPDGQPIH